MIIAVDFDGTCVTHEYPNVGRNIGAGPVLRALVKEGHKIILWTMRGNPEEDLKDALNWFKQEDIPLYGINENPSQTWSVSPKAYAHLYIDDAALGCPVISNKKILNEFYTDRPFVDWCRIVIYLNQEGYLSDNTYKILNEISDELR